MRTKEGNIHNRHRTGFSKQVEEVIKESDILLEILDARFMEKTRNPEIEKIARNLGKKIIYVLNKSDLVDVNLMRRNIDLGKLNPHLFFSSKSRRGSMNLKKVIKMEAKRTNKPSVHIGVIGYPNTGKSSVINFLCGRRSAKISSEAGTTRAIQRIRIAKGIYLIDTPGVVPQAEKFTINRGIEIKNAQVGATTWDRVKDPEMIVNNLMKENPELLEKHYGIDSNNDSEILIENLGKKSHFLLKGNLVDENRAAKKILRDWQEGKIMGTDFEKIK